MGGGYQQKQSPTYQQMNPAPLNVTRFQQNHHQEGISGLNMSSNVGQMQELNQESSEVMNYQAQSNQEKVDSQQQSDPSNSSPALDQQDQNLNNTQDSDSVLKNQNEEQKENQQEQNGTNIPEVQLEPTVEKCIIIENPTQRFVVNGEEFDYNYFGPLTVQGYLKKLTSKKSMFNDNKFQRRFFVLDLMTATFKYAKNPTAQYKWYHFKNIQFIISEGPELFCHKNYQYPFKIKVSERFYHLCAKTQQEKMMWVNGFNFLFEFRKQLNQRNGNLMPDGTPVIDDLQRYRLEQEKEYELMKKKIQDKHEKKEKKRENSLINKLKNPLMNMLVQKSFPAATLKNIKEEEKAARANSQGSQDKNVITGIPSEQNQQTQPGGQPVASDQNTITQLQALSQSETLPQELKDQVQVIQQIREQVLKEYSELEAKQDAFEKEKKDFLEFQIAETENLIKEKQKVLELKEKYKQKIEKIKRAAHQDVQDAKVSDLDSDGNQDKSKSPNKKKESPQIDTNLEIPTTQQNISNQNSPKTGKKRVIKKSVERQSAKLPLLNNQNPVISTQLKQKLLINKKLNEATDSSERPNLDLKNLNKLDVNLSTFENHNKLDPNDVKRTISANAMGNTSSANEDQENEQEQNNLNLQQPGDKPLRTFSRKKVKVQRGKSTIPGIGNGSSSKAGSRGGFMSQGFMDGMQLLNLARNNNMGISQNSQNGDNSNTVDQVQLFNNFNNDELYNNQTSGSDTQNTRKTSTQEQDNKTTMPAPLVQIEKLEQEDLENDIDNVKLNTVSLLKNRSNRKKQEEIIIDDQNDVITHRNEVVQESDDLTPNNNLNKKNNNFEDNMSPEPQIISKLGARSNSISVGNRAPRLNPLQSSTVAYNDSQNEVQKNQISTVQGSSQQQTSTIDTLLERERDAQFIDRLDKQNKMNLRGNGGTFLQKSTSIQYNHEQEFNVQAKGVTLINQSQPFNYAQFYGNKNSNTVQQQDQTSKSMNYFNNNSQQNQQASPSKNRYSSHVQNNSGNNSDQNEQPANNWGIPEAIVENIPSNIHQAKTENGFFNKKDSGKNLKNVTDGFALIKQNQNQQFSRQQVQEKITKNHSYQPQAEQPRDQCLESFDANWDDDLEQSIKMAQAVQQKKQNFKTLNVGRGEDDDVWD
eukprot:403366832